MFGLGYAQTNIINNLLNPLAQNYSPISRMVIVGPAGTGKTMLAKWMTGQSDQVTYINCSSFFNSKYEGLLALDARIATISLNYEKDGTKRVFVLDNAEWISNDPRFLALTDRAGISLVLVTRKLKDICERFYTDERCVVLNISRPTKADSIKILESVTKGAENGFVQTIINILFDEKTIIQRLRIDNGRMAELPLYAFNFISGRLLLEIAQEAKRIVKDQRSNLSIDVAKIATENVLLRLTTITFKDIEEEAWDEEVKYIIRRIPAINFK